VNTGRLVIFVARSFTGESLRSALAVTKLENVSLLGIREQPISSEDASMFLEVVCVTDTHDAKQLLDAARLLQQKHGSLNRIVTTQETLLEPVAQTVAALGIQGMRVATVRRALDKSLLKAAFEQAGIGTARSQVLTSDVQARNFAAELGYPIVLKPLNGSGALGTWTIGDDPQLALALELTGVSQTRPLLAEQYLSGQELCLDTIAIANEPRCYSICCYRPSILEAVENPAIQWRCVMPRDIGGSLYAAFIEQGLEAVRALAVGDAMTHMEGFLLDDGRPCFIDATLRPAGARIAPMLGFAYDVDPYLIWARATLDGAFDGPWERKFAVGTVFLRGTGAETIERVDGIEDLNRQLGDLVVDFRAPVVGSLKSDTYTGDGYVTVRHSETKTVDDALDFAAQTIRITYSNRASSSGEILRDNWTRRLQYRQLYKPAWEIESQTAAK
jgi:Carbamoyl-phosphate synthase L chain, ATP binding domain